MTDTEMQRPQHQVAVLTMEWPSGLKDLEEAASELCIEPVRLRQLADGGYAPHYRIDNGPPRFKISELKRWAATNLVARHGGKDIPAPVRVIAPAPRVQDFRKVPEALREIAGLCDITDEIRRTGIYFLCRDNVVLYVGQSVDAASRVGHHARNYAFETVFFIPWPGDDLDRIEGALIRALRPVLNHSFATGTMRAPTGHKDRDAEIIALITNAPTALVGEADGATP